MTLPTIAPTDKIFYEACFKGRGDNYNGFIDTVRHTKNGTFIKIVYRFNPAARQDRMETYTLNPNGVFCFHAGIENNGKTFFTYGGDLNRGYETRELEALATRLRQMVEDRERARLFIGLHAAAMVFADRHNQKHGDYATLARLPYDTLKLEVRPGCPAFLLKRIRTEAAKYKAGDTLRVAENMTVTLGTKTPH